MSTSQHVLYTLPGTRAPSSGWARIAPCTVGHGQAAISPLPTESVGESINVLLVISCKMIITLDNLLVIG